jgi:hypothetical protein
MRQGALSAPTCVPSNFRRRSMPGTPPPQKKTKQQKKKLSTGMHRTMQQLQPWQSRQNFSQTSNEADRLPRGMSEAQVIFSHSPVCSQSSSLSSSSDFEDLGFFLLFSFSGSFNCFSHTVFAASASMLGKMMSKTSLYQFTAWPSIPSLIFCRKGRKC